MNGFKTAAKIADMGLFVSGLGLLSDAGRFAADGYFLTLASSWGATTGG